jgi:hypothetical protein
LTRMISRGLVLVAGLAAVSGQADPDSFAMKPAVSTDPRLIRIRQYFLERDCPAHQYAEDFVMAADRHDLDWRLLPSLSMIESTGGKEARNNNMFGWDNCNVRFNTNREGIYRVASRLARSRFYKGKTLDQALKTYNPGREYGKRVKLVMAQLGPANLAPSGVF